MPAILSPIPVDTVADPATKNRWLARYNSFAERPMLACALVLMLTFVLRAALLPWMPVPAPNIHDEFSYLLASDTYAHGRLANPPHPFWEHFETFQVLQRPTYASKYQMLQGMTLAFGQRFFGSPWSGVFLSTGLMCAALCWMLQGCIAPGWALLGALIFALRIGVFSYWMNTYEGGGVPAIGGALALGALARIWRKRQFLHCATWALGISILVHSRPYDAAVLGLATGIPLAWHLIRTKAAWQTAWVPALAVFAVSAGAMAYYDYRVTGNPFTLPYQVQDGQYAVASMFTMMPLRPQPVYRHTVMRDFWAGWNVGQWKDAREHPLLNFTLKNLILLDFFIGYWPLALLLLLWPTPLTTLEHKAALFLCGVSLVMLTLLIAVLPHYGAAFAGVFYLRFLHTLSQLSSWTWNRKPVGMLMTGAILLMIGCGFIHSAAEVITHHRGAPSFPAGRDQMSAALWERSLQFGGAREKVIRTLQQTPGQHLVMVRYAPNHELQEEWVYNAANIDASPIVWAREMTPAQDVALLHYFNGRTTWLLEPDQSPPKLKSYSEKPR